LSIKKINIRFKTVAAVPVDKFFLDALALKHFKVTYEDKEVKKSVNKLLRELMGDIHPHPQKVEQKILMELAPKWIKKEMGIN